MVWINWSGSRNDSSSFVFSGSDTDFAFGRKQYQTKEEAYNEWYGRGYGSTPDIRWNPLPGESNNLPGLAVPIVLPQKSQEELKAQMSGARNPTKRSDIGNYDEGYGYFQYYNDGSFDFVSQEYESSAEDLEAIRQQKAYEEEQRRKAEEKRRKEKKQQEQNKSFEEAACPNGKWYRRIPFFSCDQGYGSPDDSGGLWGFTGTGICYCDNNEEAQEKKQKASSPEWKEKEAAGTGIGQLTGLLEMLPTLVILFVIISLIGAFKK